jgi:phosphoribosylamine--glycine ligase
MGAHSPSGVLAVEEGMAVLESVMRPTIAGMAQEGRPFVGVLYAGLILTEAGPRVLEFNVRMGDPEAQPLMLRLESDLLPVLAAGAAGDFGDHEMEFAQEAASCVVLASPGYPGKPETGEPIEGLGEAAELPGVEIFHAGTALDDGRIVSSGGRVLNVCARAPLLSRALERAYEAADKVRWPRKVMRRDIGRRVVRRIEQ